MTAAAQLDTSFISSPVACRPGRLQVALASSPSDIRAAQRLRHAVFIEEMGATLECVEQGIESDRFDQFCQHLLVRDVVVGCYRILTGTQATLAGDYYSAQEFDLTRVLALPGRFMEVGLPACMHPDYRTGATISLLWAGVAGFMAMNNYQYLMGCARLPLAMGMQQISTICHYLYTNHYSSPE